MSELKNEACEACRPDAIPLTDREIDDLMVHVPEWQVAEVDGVKQLQRIYSFKNFAEALAFTNRVGEAAEEVGHHPLLITEWGRVTVAWWSHKIKGLHRSDFIMAARCDDFYARATS